MARDFISELTNQLSYEQPSWDCIRAARTKLADWQQYYDDMQNKASPLWDEAVFVAIFKEYKAIRALLKSNKLLPPEKSVFLDPEDK